MNYKLWYIVTDSGDGDAEVEFFNDEKSAVIAADDNDQEGRTVLCEPTYLELTMLAEVLFFNKPIWTDGTELTIKQFPLGISNEN